MTSGPPAHFCPCGIAIIPMAHSQMKTTRLSHRIKVAGLTLLLTVSSFACNATEPETLSVHGKWTGYVAELELDLAMVLIGGGETGITGFAEVSSLSMGEVMGEVSGAQDGADVDFTIEIEGAIVSGSLVFDGAFQGEDTMTGTLSSGLLGGSWPITLEKEEV